MPDSAAEPTPVSTASMLGTLALVVAAIAALVVVDSFLARLDHAARRSEAAHLVRDAGKLAAEGRKRLAVERFRTAVSLDRGNRAYRLGLVHALVADGRLAEADSTLDRMLAEDATDGELNLVLARVLVREDQVPEAISHYHRAVYGQWATDPEAARIKVRLELVELLARTGARDELLAELLPLQAAGVSDTALERRIGHLFLLAGAPDEGAEVFRELLRHDRSNADSHAGLAEAEFMQGNYRDAEASFRAASRLRPRDSATARQLQLVGQVLTLDPLRRGLSAAERNRRSGLLLQLAVEATDRCPGPDLADSLRPAVDSARAALRATAPRGALLEAADAKVDLAERLHAFAGPRCRSSAAGAERALDLVLQRLAN